MWWVALFEEKWTIPRIRDAWEHSNVQPNFKHAKFQTSWCQNIKWSQELLWSNGDRKWLFRAFGLTLTIKLLRKQSCRWVLIWKWHMESGNFNSLLCFLWRFSYFLWLERKISKDFKNSTIPSSNDSIRLWARSRSIDCKHARSEPTSKN